MSYIRFSYLCSNRTAAKRVFIRTDLNVPQNEAGEITENTISRLHDCSAVLVAR